MPKDVTNTNKSIDTLRVAFKILDKYDLGFVKLSLANVDKIIEFGAEIQDIQENNAETIIKPAKLVVFAEADALQAKASEALKTAQDTWSEFRRKNHNQMKAYIQEKFNEIKKTFD